MTRLYLKIERNPDDCECRFTDTRRRETRSVEDPIMKEDDFFGENNE